jgi:Fe-S cluster biogenesis protein NfuA
LAPSGSLCARGRRETAVSRQEARTVLRAKVEEVIEVIRPIIQADQGDVVLHDVDEETGLVTVELVGACVSCPASTQTLKAGLERILMDRAPGVTEVINVGETLGDVSETSVSL